MSHANTPRDWVRRAPQHGAVERIEAYFAGHGYDPHRHDTYAIGQTLAGVQSFRYRRSQRHSLPGGCLVLHPDELHDGEAGSQEGFRYRMLYVEPALIQQALGGRPLPFVRGGLSDDPRLIAASRALLQAMDTPLEPLEEQDALFELAHALDAVAGNRARGRRHFDFVAAERARQYIHAHRAPAEPRRTGAGRPARTLEPVARFPRAVRHQPLPLPDPAPAGHRPPADARRPDAGRSRACRRFHRPEPHDPPFRPELRPATGTLAAYARPRLARLHDHPRPPAP